MSRRFGRNQKRAMREAVAVAQGKAAQAAGRARAVDLLAREALAKLDYMDGAIRRLGWATALLPAHAVRWSDEDINRVPFLLQVGERATDRRFAGPGDGRAVSRLADLSVVEVALVSRKITRNHLELCKDVHFIVEGGQHPNSWSYRASDRVLRSFPPDVRERFAASLVGELLDQVERDLRQR